MFQSYWTLISAVYYSLCTLYKLNALCAVGTLYILTHITISMVMCVKMFPALVLQKPYKTSTSKDHSKCIERRLVDWEAGRFLALFEEAKAIQARLTTSTAPRHTKTMARRFAELMMMGKVEAATCLITVQIGYP